MGEVYRARDTKLDRDVALKVLPQAFTDDPDRLARFEREAKVLASLNHPNIGHIYGLEEAEGQKALVLELVEGPTLADLSIFSSNLACACTSKPTPWNMNVEWGEAYRVCPARKTTLPIELMVPVLWVVSSIGRARSVLYSVTPCMTEPPGVESCALGFSWTLDCERVLAGGVSR